MRNIIIIVVCLTFGFYSGYTRAIEYSNLKTIATVISAEACGEGEYGMLAVANTIHNRMKIKKKSAIDIVSEPYQYSGYNAPLRNKLYEECGTISLTLARNIERLEDVTGGGLYFKTPQEKKQNWHKELTVVIKNHEFYK